MLYSTKNYGAVTAPEPGAEKQLDKHGFVDASRTSHGANVRKRKAGIERPTEEDLWPKK